MVENDEYHSYWNDGEDLKLGVLNLQSLATAWEQQATHFIAYKKIQLLMDALVRNRDW